jgi:hypothetical protein
MAKAYPKCLKSLQKKRTLFWHRHCKSIRQENVAVPHSGQTSQAHLVPKTKPVQQLGQKVPAHIVKAVADASAKVGVNFAYLMDKANTESSFNPTAKAKTSSASGMFQFIESTWLDMVNKYGAQHGLAKQADAISKTRDGKLVVADKATRREILELRKDPKVASLMAAEYANENKKTLEKNLGRTVGETELYLAHFLGAGGATKFLKAMDRNPSASAASLLPEAASSNRSVFFGKSGKSFTLAQVFDRFEQKFDNAGTYVAELQPSTNTLPAMADVHETVQPGAVPGAATPLFSTHLLAALSTGEEDNSISISPGSLGIYDMPVQPRPAFEGFA